jgi:Beta-galactosidase, domain 2/Glycosyl hydrolases family 35
VNPAGGLSRGCLQKSNQDFVNLFYHHNIAEKSTAFSIYTVYGGTNWGWLAFPFVGTATIIRCPISKDRGSNAKYCEIKLLALFTRVATDLRMCDRLRNDTFYTTTNAILATELRNLTTNAKFYVVRHNTSTSDSSESFKTPREDIRRECDHP